jgi:hypothetical protein
MTVPEGIQASHVVAAFIGFIIPTILFAWRLHYMVKRTLDMHHQPDRHGFGTGKTNELLSKHMDDELEMHRQSISAMSKLGNTISELSYYVRWMGKQQTGKTPPPYVRNGD